MITGGASSRRASFPFGLLIPPALALLAFVSLPASMGYGARATAATALLMAGWWLSEAVPLAATSLIPIVAFPALGLGTAAEATAPYADKVIYLFLGGMLIASSLERWELHRRIALWTVARAGAAPGRIVAAFMGVTAFMSLWMSNTAIAMLMLSIGNSLLAVVDERGLGAEQKKAFGACLVLGIAYAATIGGLGTLIGTPPNALFAAFVSRHYGAAFPFNAWMIVGLPLAAAFLPVTWWLLTRRLFPLSGGYLPGGREFFASELASLGPMRPAERRVLAVFAVTAAGWVLGPFLARLPGLPAGLFDDTVVAMTGALALFLLPAGEGDGERLLDWSSAEKLPWGVLILFGGGLTLSAAITRHGLDRHLGELLKGASALGPVGLLALTTAAIVGLTELASNTATAAALLPVFAAVAEATGARPEALLVPVALAASCGFMLPAGTPPNALAFASGRVTIREMARAGLWLDLLSILLIPAVMLSFGRWLPALR